MRMILMRMAMICRVTWTVAVMSCAAAAASTDDIERELDRVVDLFESGSDDLASAMLDTAIGQLDAIVEKEPNNANAQFLLGRAYGYAGEEKLSAAAYARAAEL